MSMDVPHRRNSTLRRRRRNNHVRPLPEHGNRRATTSLLSEPAQFALFVKVLLRYLKLVGEHKRLAKARVVIRECVLCNRSGYQAYAPLRGAVEACLYWTVGPYHWSQAQRLFRRVCQRRGLAVDVRWCS